MSSLQPPSHLSHFTLIQSCSCFSFDFGSLITSFISKVNFSQSNYSYWCCQFRCLNRCFSISENFVALHFQSGLLSLNRFSTFACFEYFGRFRYCFFVGRKIVISLAWIAFHHMSFQEDLSLNHLD